MTSSSSYIAAVSSNDIACGTRCRSKSPLDMTETRGPLVLGEGHVSMQKVARVTPTPCASTALSKHRDRSDRRFSDRSFRFPLMSTALSKHGDPSDRCFPDFQHRLRKGEGGQGRIPSNGTQILAQQKGEVVACL